MIPSAVFLLESGWKLICCLVLIYYVTIRLMMTSLLSISSLLLPTTVIISKSITSASSVLSSSRILANQQRNVFLRAVAISTISPEIAFCFNKDPSVCQKKFYSCHNKFQVTAQLSRIMSSSSAANLVVEHDPTSQKFFIKLGDDEAKLEYSKSGDVLNMWHTEVPPALQGKGIAKILAQEAFDYVVKQDLKMQLSCTYLQKYYRDNPKPEYTEHLA